MADRLHAAYFHKMNGDPIRSIIVVDDDLHTREQMAGVLIRSGYNVDTAVDGHDGWQAIQANPYDLIITDNKMQRMTGIEMIEKVRAACMTLPVLMATRYLPDHEFARRPWLKPDAVLERPFSDDDLTAAVEKLLAI
jgi:two-component system sensor histidine kinase and response regulator WspE